jgi:predicted nucleic acid-binding protein
VTARGSHVEARLFRPGEILCAPHLLDLEIAQVLRRYDAAGDLSSARAREALDDLTDFPIVRFDQQPLLPRIWELRKNATSYDAAYLALAETLDATVVTCDAHLAPSPGHGARLELL